MPSNIIKEIKHNQDYTVISLTGEIDMKKSMPLREKLIEELAAKPKYLIIDLAEVSFMDSSGLAVLIEALQRTQKGSVKLKLIGLQQQVRSIFEIARLDAVFEIHETEQEAIK